MRQNAGRVDTGKRPGLHCAADKMGEGARKPVGARHGPATVTGERTPQEPLPEGPAGRPGEAGIRESGDLTVARRTDRGEDPEGGISYGRYR